MSRLKSKSFWLTGLTVFAAILCLTFYQMYDLIRDVAVVEDVAMSAMKGESSKAAQLYDECSTNSGAFQGKYNLTKKSCYEAVIFQLTKSGRGDEARIAVAKYKIALDRGLAGYKEPWPLNILGMPLIRAFL